MLNYRNNLKVALLFLFPALIVYLLFVVTPMLSSFYFAFNDWPGIKNVPLKFVGLDNFKELFHDKEFISSIKNVFLYVVWSVFTQIPIGFFIAIVLGRLRTATRFFKAVFFFPLILPATSVFLMWNFIFFPTDSGALNHLLITLGLSDLTRTWLVDENTAFGIVILVTTWSSFGYYMTIGLAALAGIPDEVHDSAKMDGAAGFRKLVYITLPMIWESIKISVVFVITGVLKIFDIIFVMTNGGPNGSTQVPATLMYEEAFKYGHYGLGSAISTVIFAISLLLTVISLKLMQWKKEEL